MSTTEAATAPTWPWPRFFRYVYAAKFLCGELKETAAAAREGPVEPGSYSTAINVHNPHAYPVAIRKKAILLYDGSHPQDAVERPIPPVHSHDPVTKQLGPDYGLEIDCSDIREVLLAAPGTTGPKAPTFIKGWVVVETLVDAALDVVAVYTVTPLGPKGEPQPVSIDTERVPGSRTLFPGF